MILTAAGEIDVSTAPRLATALTEAAALAQPGDPLVLDLTAVEFLDSTGISALIVAHRNAEHLHLTWRICGLQPIVRRTRGSPHLYLHLACQSWRAT